MLECNFFLTLRSFGDKIQRHSDPTSKSLLSILRDLIIVDVLANMNQSSRRSCRSLSVRGFPKRMRRPYCHVVTFPPFSGSARGRCDGVRQLNSTGRFRFMLVHVCEQIG
jgi:hypothetical protein